MYSEHTPSEHTPSEHSYSADPSGYITSRPRGHRPAEVERDPYDDVREVNSVPRAQSPPPNLQGPRVRTTARKSVPLPRCVNFTNQTRFDGESSRSGARHGTPQLVTGVPVAPPPGMTARESRWVLFLSQDVQLHKERLDLQHQHLNGIMDVLKAHDEVSDRTMELVDVSRREIRTLYMYLLWVIGALVLVIGMLIWMMMR